MKLRNKVLDYLYDVGPSTTAEIATALGLSRDNVYQVLVRAKGEVYITDWNIEGRLCAIWKAGRGYNKKRPEPMSFTERHRRWRAKNPEKYAIAKRKGSVARGFKPRTKKKSQIETLLGL